MADTIFGTDRPLLYNIEPWASLGYAVPNWGGVIGTRNLAIWRLADEVGRCQLLMDTHTDMRRLQYPSINTITALGKMLNRAKVLLAGRQKASTVQRLDEGHANAQMQPWNVHPTPFFNSSICRNPWLNEYNRLVMIALINMYQHSDNGLALDITAEFAASIWAFFREISLRMGTELLGLPAEAIVADEFQFSDESYAGYATIADRVPSMERLDTPGPVQTFPTERDLYPFLQGIPANQLLTSLAEYSAGPGDVSVQGTGPDEQSKAPGTSDGSGVNPQGIGAIGQPQV